MTERTRFRPLQVAVCAVEGFFGRFLHDLARGDALHGAYLLRASHGADPGVLPGGREENGKDRDVSLPTCC